MICKLAEDLIWVKDLVGSCFQIEVRALFGFGDKDDKEVIILGHVVVGGL